MRVSVSKTYGSYDLLSNDKEYNETIAKMREMDLDRVWLDQEIAHYEKKLEQLRQEKNGD